MLRETEFESDELLELVATTMPACIWHVAADLRLLSSYGVGLSGLRMPSDASDGRSLFEVYGTTDPEHPGIAAHRAALAGESTTFTLDGAGRVFSCFASPRRNAGGAVVGVRGFAIDVTAERELREALHRSQESLSLAQSAARLGTWTWELANGRVTWSDELFALCDIVPRTEQPSVALLWRFVHPDDRIALMAAIDVAREERGSFFVDTRVATADGSERWVQHRGRYVADSNGSGRMLGTVLDITPRKRAEALTNYHANYDDVTGLPNRKLLADRLQRALIAAEHADSQVAVLYLDLDRFKSINDTLGHHVGDEFLRRIVPRIAGALRPTDTLARSGGDEFIAIVPDIGSIGEAGRIAERMLAEISGAVEIDGRELYSSASIGISLFPDDGSTADAMIRAADAALLRAREGGLGSFRFYSAATHARAVGRIELESALRGAYDRSEFVLHYQAVVDRFERPVAIEALVRWDRPGAGLVGPDRFIPLCEETGLIVPLGRWIIRKAFAELAGWLAAGLPPVRLALNVSASQLRDPAIVRDVGAWLEEFGLRPSAIDLEITESVLMNDVGGVRRAIADLRNLGMRISLDDFGTGYSTLSYLKHFSVDALKIDRTFVRDLPHDRGDAAIVSAVVALGHAMGLVVVAEGVENQEQAALVRRLGCDELQGFYFAKPVALGELERYVRSRIG